MNKKEYQILADSVSQIEDKVNREKIIEFLVHTLKQDNSKFNERKFIEWIERRRKGQSMKGMNYNSKYMPLGVN